MPCTGMSHTAEPGRIKARRGPRTGWRGNDKKAIVQPRLATTSFVAFWLLILAGLMLVGWLAPPEVLGRDVQPQSPEKPGPVKTEPPQDPGPLSPIREKWRSLQSELLTIISADQGTHETVFPRRIQIRYEYRDRQDGSRRDRAVLRIDTPFLERWVLRVDAQYIANHPEAGGSTETGLGDVLVRLGARVYQTAQFSLFAGGDVRFDTASDRQLGRGKNQVAPGVAASIPLPEVNSIIFPLLQHWRSVGGNPDRRKVNYTEIRVSLNTPWSQDWWTKIDADTRLDWTRNRKMALLLAGEVGRKLNVNFRIWTRWGTGLTGRGVPGTYDWEGEVGVRYIF